MLDPGQAQKSVQNYLADFGFPHSLKHARFHRRAAFLMITKPKGFLKSDRPAFCGAAFGYSLRNTNNLQIYKFSKDSGAGINFSPEDCLSQAEAAGVGFERGGRGRSRSCGRRVPQKKNLFPYRLLFHFISKILFLSLNPLTKRIFCSGF